LNSFSIILLGRYNSEKNFTSIQIVELEYFGLVGFETNSPSISNYNDMVTSD